MPGIRRALRLHLRRDPDLRLLRLPAGLHRLLSLLWHRGLRHRVPLSTVARTPALLPAPLHLALPASLQPVARALELRLHVLVGLPAHGIALEPRLARAASGQLAALVRPRRLPPSAA